MGLGGKSYSMRGKSMFETILNKYAIKQINFSVPDVEDAARRHSEFFGTGPFFVDTGMKADRCIYKGEEIEFVNRSAFTQWGGIQLELTQQISESPTYLTDRGYGFNHICIWVDDLDAAVKVFQDHGYGINTIAEAGGDVNYFMDCYDDFGFYVELYAPTQEFEDFLCESVESWDGKDPVRVMGIDDMLESFFGADR